MKRLLLLCALLLAGCAEPRAVAAPLPTAPPTPGMSAAVLADNVATLEMLQAAVTLEAGRTATADAATRAVEQWQATQEAGAVMATAEERAALATGTAQAFGSTQTAMPLVQTQTAMSLTALAATQQAVAATGAAVQVTLAYSAALNAATATQFAQVAQMKQESESASRWKTLWDGFTYALVYGAFGLVTAFFGLLWLLRHIPKRYMEVRIARLRLANVGGHAPIWLPDGAAAPQSLPFGEPAAIINNDGTRTEIPVTDADMQPERSTPAPTAPADPAKSLAARFLLECFRYAEQNDKWPANAIPGWRKFAEAHQAEFDTGDKWSLPRHILAPHLEKNGGHLIVARRWGDISGLYNALQHNQITVSLPAENPPTPA